MYSRKQFFIAAAERCLNLIKSCTSLHSFQKEYPTEESAELIPKSLFLEAIRLGIDPGTMGEEQLIMAINSSRDDHNRRQTPKK